MILYLLDTNAASAALKGNAAVDKRLQDLPACRMVYFCVYKMTRTYTGS